jgi:hypothetical protein
MCQPPYSQPSSHQKTPVPFLVGKLPRKTVLCLGDVLERSTSVWMPSCVESLRSFAHTSAKSVCPGSDVQYQCQWCVKELVSPFSTGIYPEACSLSEYSPVYRRGDVRGARSGSVAAAVAGWEEGDRTTPRPALGWVPTVDVVMEALQSGCGYSEQPPAAGGSSEELASQATTVDFDAHAEEKIAQPPVTPVRWNVRLVLRLVAEMASAGAATTSSQVRLNSSTQVLCIHQLACCWRAFLSPSLLCICTVGSPRAHHTRRPLMI